jgi:hypothetical protein
LSPLGETNLLFQRCDCLGSSPCSFSGMPLQRRPHCLLLLSMLLPAVPKPRRRGPGLSHRQQRCRSFTTPPPSSNITASTMSTQRARVSRCFPRQTSFTGRDWAASSRKFRKGFMLRFQ